MELKRSGHATSKDFSWGHVTARDKHGHDAADRLAGDGAAAHALPERTVKEVRHSKMVVRDVQLMMVDIWLARSKEQSTFASRGSFICFCPGFGEAPILQPERAWGSPPSVFQFQVVGEQGSRVNYRT